MATEGRIPAMRAPRTSGRRGHRRGELVSRGGYALRLALVCGAYFGLAKAGLAFAFANQSVTAIWPPTGLALAAVVIWGYRMWSGVALGAFLANATTAGSVPTDLGIAAGNTLEALAGAYLLANVAHFHPSLDRVRDVLALVAYAAILSTTISATIGVASLAASGLVPAGGTGSTWRVWWLGDVGGDLIVAPALLVLASRPRLESRPWIWAEGLGLLALLVGVSVTVFATGQRIAYIVFPILFWIGSRYRQVGVVIGGLITSGIAVGFTAHGQGPFIGGSSDTELLRSQTFVGVAMITGLLIAALTAERSRTEDELRHRAEHDSLTGLFNRTRFTQELEHQASYNARYGGLGAVLVVDVDRFKRVNDALGHAAGDELIARLSGLLRECLRDTDVVGRWGGDEFTVLLPQASEAEAVAVAGRLLDKVRHEASIVRGRATVPVTVSIGITPFGPGIDLDPEQIMRSADAAMYQAKLAGRDRFERSELGWRRAGPESGPGPAPRRAAPRV
jgi:diguanylate cyclase